jgi:hypothetical protein
VATGAKQFKRLLEEIVGALRIALQERNPTEVAGRTRCRQTSSAANFDRFFEESGGVSIGFLFEGGLA